jgi:proteasome accessory factor B
MCTKGSGRAASCESDRVASEDRFERVTNLVTYLLSRERGATLAEIVEELPGWPATVEARRRAFERDKRVLRDEGIPLVEEGGRYRIPADQYYLPDLDLTADEQVALRLAVAAVPLGGESAGLALHKLTLGGGGAGDWEGSASVVAALDEQPLLPVLHAAVRRRQVVTFRYRDGSLRRVEPSLLFFRDGNWYLTGHDQDRDARRSFRVDRVDGDVAVSEPGAFERRLTSAGEAMPREPWLIGGDERDTAVVDVDAVLAAKAVVDVGGRGDVETRADGSVRITMDVTNRAAFRSWVLGMLDHAVVVAPADLRAELTDWLERMAGSAADVGADAADADGDGAQGGASAPNDARRSTTKAGRGRSPSA